MAKQDSKVIPINHEIINKNTDLFIDITTTLERLIKKGLASFSFDYRETSITFEPDPEVENAFTHYDPENVQNVIEEVIEITLMLLDNQENQLLTDADNEGQTARAIMDKKISSVKENIITKKLQNGYYFYRTCISNVLEQFVAQRVVKPPANRFPALDSLMVRLTVKDNLDPSSREDISFELYQDQLDELISLLCQLKQEFNNGQQDQK